MYWLQPPPYARWAAAALLIVGAAAWDLRGPATTPYPFAARAVAAGTALGEADVVWRAMPDDAYPVPDLAGATAAVDLAPGEPISAAVVAATVAIPDDWWAVPIAIGTHAMPGEAVLLVVIDPPLSVPGIVVSAQQGDRFSLDHRPAVVAVPGESAALIAAAEAAGLVVAAVRP